MQTKNEMYEILKTSIASITFLKVDGTERKMKCSLNPKFLPEQLDMEEYISKKNKNDSVIAVWDIEKEGWRSFRVDSVKEFEVYETI